MDSFETLFFFGIFVDIFFTTYINYCKDLLFRLTNIFLILTSFCFKLFTFLRLTKIIKGALHVLLLFDGVIFNVTELSL